MVSSTSIRVRNTTNEETANNKSSFSKRRRPDSAYSSHQSIRDEEVSGELCSRKLRRSCLFIGHSKWQTSWMHRAPPSTCDALRLLRARPLLCPTATAFWEARQA